MAFAKNEGVDTPLPNDVSNAPVKKARSRKKKVDAPELPRTEGEPIRRLKGTKRLHHDLFKLKIAKFKKILGIPDINLLKKNPELVRIVDVEHCHFFHSVDSNGRPQKYSNSIGGHCHEIKVYMDEHGVLQAECGPPLRRLDKSRAEPKEQYDYHTHEIEYIESEEFTARVANQDAVVYASRFTTPLPPIGAQ
jgi:hypothetical protein